MDGHLLGNVWNIGVLAIVIIAWVVESLLYKNIKQYHHEKYIEFGKPKNILETIIFSLDHPFGFMTLSENLKYFKQQSNTFKKVWRYILIGDPELDADKRVRNIRFMLIALLFILLVFFVGVFISSFFVDRLAQ